jgi:hypothetical protein
MRPARAARGVGQARYVTQKSVARPSLLDSKLSLIHIPSMGLGLSVCHRAGNTTICTAILAAGHSIRGLTPEQFAPCNRRIAFLREPHSRCESAWRMYLQDPTGSQHKPDGLIGAQSQAQSAQGLDSTRVSGRCGTELPLQRAKVEATPPALILTAPGPSRWGPFQPLTPTSSGATSVDRLLLW